MSENVASKPVINEVVRSIETILGLQEDEEFRVSGPNGFYKPVTVRGLFTTAYYLSNILNNPEVIKRKPFLTESEEAIVKAVGADAVSYTTSDGVMLWRDGHLLAVFNKDLFPSIQSGTQLTTFRR